MFDLIVRNANLPDGRMGYDIAVKGGKIVHVHDAMNPNQHVKETLDAVTALARPTPAKKAKTSGG